MLLCQSIGGKHHSKFKIDMFLFLSNLKIREHTYIACGGVKPSAFFLHQVTLISF